MVKISEVKSRQVLDSRGNPTVWAQVILDNGIKASAITPSGASTGKLEAVELRDNACEFFGKSVMRAVRNVQGPISNALKGIRLEDMQDVEHVDATMIELDGTANKAKLGANATTAVSFATLRACAKTNKKQIYQLMNGTVLPVPFMNVINGGKHAGSGLAVQEIMISPLRVKSFSQAIMAGVEIYHTLKNMIKKQYGLSGVNVGDEGGFAPMISKTKDALNILEQAIDEAGYKKNVFIASDPASSSFYDAKTKSYTIDGGNLSAEELHDYWVELIKEYNIMSLEDPFDESDFYSFSKLRQKVGSYCQIVGDDLTVTNLKMIKKAKKQRAMNALLLKVNQIGTVSEAIESAQYCFEHKMGVMVSHRSGESEDTTIADLSVGLNCGQIKTGAPCRAERTAKYNRLLQIEDELGSKAKYLQDKSIVRY